MHISFIADGNRRWAKRRLLPKFIGHKVGFDKMISIADYCCGIGIEFISFFCFSTENWNREQAEIDDIFNIITNNISKQTEHFIANGMKVVFLGDLSKFPVDFQLSANECMKKTENLTKTTVCFFCNYGGRADIANAFRLASIANDLDFEKYLYTNSHGIPDPDIVIRTSGEYRISNFLLYQMAYAELFFIPTYWPNMHKGIIDEILIEYKNRDRRHGK
ncbi:MAG: di-trans,poly-cis-decaprenylcistransferase [Christensenellaceae bacterium]|nr:di-trans,poly-cis-decaprenylcistransferase [Christensenellaceae bacterium]